MVCIGPRLVKLTIGVEFFEMGLQIYSSREESSLNIMEM